MNKSEEIMNQAGNFLVVMENHFSGVVVKKQLGKVLVFQTTIFERKWIYTGKFEKWINLFFYLLFSFNPDVTSNLNFFFFFIFSLFFFWDRCGKKKK